MLWSKTMWSSVFVRTLLSALISSSKIVESKSHVFSVISIHKNVNIFHIPLLVSEMQTKWKRFKRVWAHYLKKFKSHFICSWSILLRNDTTFQSNPIWIQFCLPLFSAYIDLCKAMYCWLDWLYNVHIHVNMVAIHSYYLPCALPIAHSTKGLSSPIDNRIFISTLNSIRFRRRRRRWFILLLYFIQQVFFCNPHGLQNDEQWQSVK